MGNVGPAFWQQSAVGGYWNPADKNAAVVLSNGNKEARNTAPEPATRGVRAVKGRSSGRFYFELATTSGYTTAYSTEVFAGLANAAVGLSGLPGYTAIGGVYIWAEGSNNYGTDAGVISSFPGIGWANNGAGGVQSIGFDADLTARSVDVYYGGVKKGTIAYAAPGGPMYPWTQNTDLGGAGITLRLKASEFAFSIPAGSTEWGT